MRSRSERRSPIAIGSESTADRSWRSLAVSGHVPRGDLDGEHLDRDAVLAAHVGGPDVHAVQGQRPRHRGEQTAAVRCRHDHPGRLERHGRKTRLAHFFHEVPVGLHDAIRAGGLGLTLEHVVGPLDEVGDEAGLPVAPGGGPRGPAVRLGQGGEQVERQSVADGAGDAGDRGGIVEVAPRGRVGQQEMMAHEVDQHVDVGGREPHARGDVLDDLHADGGVVAGITLADVVQKRADQEQIRPLDPIGQLGGECRGLQEVPVDGEGVVGVALGLVAYRGPLGNEAHQQAVLVERLDLVDGGSARARAGRRAPRGSRPTTGRPAGACGRPGDAASPWRSAGPARPRWPPGAVAATYRRRRGRVVSARSRRRPPPCRGRGRRAQAAYACPARPGGSDAVAVGSGPRAGAGATRRR